MKKVILVILAVLSLFFVYGKVKENSVVKIPDSAIRFRILANSNSPRDQKIKQDIAKKMQDELYMLLKSTKNVYEARSIINDNINTFDEILKDATKDLDYSYTIDYGIHEFPEKTYKGVVYEAGDYESLLVTLGEGKGDNWWCVLFPPMCLMEAEETNATELEYKSFIKEVIEKYF